MREFAVPATYTVPATGSLTDAVLAHASDDADRVVLRRRTGAAWVDVTAGQFLAEVRRTAKGLVGAGVAAGDRVALISKTRYEWTLVDYAIWYAGAVSVPVYETSTPDAIGWILTDCEAVLAIAETGEHRRRIDAVRSTLPSLREVVGIDDGGLDELADRGRCVDDDTVESRRSAVTPESLATVIYTSGTTGRPKGCLLTHGNLMFEVGVTTQLLEDLFDLETSSTVIFLPLAHVFARVIQVACVSSRVRLGHTADVRTLVDDLGAFSPTFVLAVPRVLEKIYNTARSRAVAEGRGRVFDAAVRTAVAYSRACDLSGPGPLLRARHGVFDRLVYARLRATLGGKTEYAVSGGAPLGERLAHFFRGAGIPVLEGYGLTETTASVTVNLPHAVRIGTVGRPLPGTTVRVADDGELLVRGSQVFTGYLGDEEATRKVLDDAGWLHTGDLGEIDDDGYVRVTGRKQEILVTAGGKNVAPAVLEDRIRGAGLVSQCLVVGDGRPFVAALITLDASAVAVWMAAAGKTGSPASGTADPDLLAEIQSVVDDANSVVSRAEAIRKFAVLPYDWTEDSGDLTPTLKLKRARVAARHCDEIDALYS